jgi:phytoene synthase
MLSPLGAMMRQHDPDRFLATLFAPADRRETLFVLGAFNHELARAREVASQPMLALIRLQWWREVVEGARRRHEVAGPLGEAIDSGALDPVDLLAMVDAREIETEDSVPTLDAWLDYLGGTAGGYAVAAGRALGADPAILERLRRFGIAYGVAGQIANVEILARQERCLLPADVLGAHGLTPDHVIRDPRSAAPALRELADLGQNLLRDIGGPVPRPLVAAVLPAVLARRDLRRGVRLRGLGDKAAVVAAALRARV